MREIDGSTSAPKVTYRQQYRRCNKPDCPTCRGTGRGHGPYWFACWREGGKQHQRYLGREAPAAAEAPTPAVRGAALRVRTLGAFAVWRGSQQVPAPSWRQRGAAALFKCLLSAPQHRVHREVLIEWLWPQATPAQGGAQLRRTLYSLRRLLGDSAGGPGYLRLDGDTLVLEPAPGEELPEGWLDAAAFAEAAAAALGGRSPRACRRALSYYGGEYLPEDRYAAWALGRREALQEQYLAVLLHLASLREEAGVLGEAARCLRTVLTIDPCHEPAGCALMRVEAAAGHFAGAVRVYEQLVAALDRELGVQPDGETERQYEAVLAGRQVSARRQSNLPTPLTSFLGREQELRLLVQRLVPGPGDRAAPGRLVTLTGAGGCGKSRLAIELGHELRTRFTDGVWLVELATLAADEAPDPDRIARQAVEVFGLRPGPAQSPLAALLAFLQPRQVLLLLDNCEHLIAGSAAFVREVLAASPGVRVLTTSREALGVLGETTCRLPSLAVPECGEPDLRAVSGAAAVRLLVERARLVRPDFALTMDNCRAVTEICRQLDGMPLAVELAAARLAQLAPAEVAARLHDRFRLLTTGNRAALPRHQTLRAAMDWSYELLGIAEQALLRRLSVFAGGCTLEAAEWVCAGALVPAEHMLDLLGRLVTKSLVTQPDNLEVESEGRYRLLETVRQYAAERLAASGEGELVRSRHYGYYFALAQRAETSVGGSEQGRWAAVLEREHDNLRGALHWRRTAAASSGEAGEAAANDAHHGAAAIALVAALAWFWEVHGHWTEGRAALAEALAGGADGAPAIPLPLRLKALTWAGRLAMRQSDLPQSAAYYEQAAGLARALDDRASLAAALNGLGNVAYWGCDYPRAARYLEEALAIRQAIGDRRGMAVHLNNLGNVASARGELDRARAFHERSLTLVRALGNKAGIAASLNNLAIIASYQRQYTRAMELHDEGSALRRELGDRSGLAAVNDNVAFVLQAQGELDRAAALHQEGIRIREELGERMTLAYSYQGLGRIALARQQYGMAAGCFARSAAISRETGDSLFLAETFIHVARLAAAMQEPRRALELCSASEQLRASLGAALVPPQADALAEAMAAARATLGEADCASAWHGGHACTLDQAVELALESLAGWQ